jgi:hypothetical protein
MGRPTKEEQVKRAKDVAAALENGHHKVTIERLTKERGRLHAELLDTNTKLRETERELTAIKRALILMSETLIERSQGTWTAQIVMEPRIAAERS